MQTLDNILKHKLLTLCIVTFLWLVTGVSFAQNESAYKESIKSIDNEIKNLSRNLNANKSKFELEQSGLLEAEQALAKIDEKLSGVRAEMVQSKALISELEIKQNELSLKQADSRKALKGLIASNYKNGVPNKLKMVLNQENPYALGRLNNYQAYFSQAILSRFEELEKQVQASQELRSIQQIKVAELQNIEQEQEFLKSQQEGKKQQRLKVLDRLALKMASVENKLKKLKTDRTRLNELLEQLEKQKRELERIEREREKAEKLAIEKAKKEGKKPPKKAKRNPVRGGFAKQKGRLTCPVESSPETKYGQRIVSSGMVSEGVFYNTKQSQEVRSIFRGQVLFADFLKGFGLLIIVDHGDDHISLYGHNEVLYKKVGDSVATNEVISKSGKTGGLKTNGLYFEIRRNATPVNPLTWCQ